MIVGVGCDIVEIERIKVLIDKGMASKLLTPKEQTAFADMTVQRRPEWLAGRFAAKEAIFKALPSGVISTISQIEVDSDAKGKPICVIPNYQIHCSISHEKAYAIAYAICEQ